MFNLSSTTPGAPAGRHDVAMQADGLANISATDTDGPAEILTTKGDLQGFGTAPDRLPAGPDNTFIVYDSGQPLGIATRALVAGDIPAIPESRVTSLVSDLALKAPLASPALTGVPTAPTASTPTNTTQIATTAYVQAQGYLTSIPTASEAINAQTGASYTFVSGDQAKLVTFSNGSSVAVTLPQAIGSFGAGWYVDVYNLGAGLVTITPTTSTVNGASTLVLKQYQGARIDSDATNYKIFALNVTNLAGTGPGGVTGILPVANGGTGASTFPLVIGFVMGSGATGTNVGPELIAPHAGNIAACKLLVKSSDPTVDLTFRINKNGTSIFTSDQTITHGTAAGTLSTITALTSVPLSVAADDKFTIDITSGNSSWAFTAQPQS